jgi:hypothetical protein
MSNSIKSKYKVKKVNKVLNLIGAPSQGDIYEIYRVSDRNGLVKDFRFKYEAMAWINKVTARPALTAEQLYNFNKGR